MSITVAPATRIALAVSCGLFVDLTDTAALATALPTLAREFRVDPLALKLVLTTYLVVAAMLIPLSGWLADRYGARRIFLIALSLFLLGSTACALSSSLDHLIIARMLQGAGGGLMTPVGRLIVVGTARRSELVNALNWFTIPAILGPLAGPPLAGLLIAFASWRWVFVLNIPIGLLGLVLVRRMVPPLIAEQPRPLDRMGASLAILGIGSFMVTTELIGFSHLSVGAWLAIASGTAAINIAMVRYMLRKEDAILDLRLFRLPTFRAAIVGSGAIRLAVGAMPFLFPLLLQTTLGWSPLESGMVMLVATLGSISARLVGPFTLRLLGFRNMLIVFSVCGAIASASPAVYRPWTPVALIFVMTTIANITRVTHFLASTALSFSEVLPEHSSRASTLSAMAQQLTLSLGVSFGAVTLSLSRGASGAPLTSGDFMLPYIAIGIVGLLALPGYVRLPKDAGEDMRYQGAPEPAPPRTSASGAAL